MSAPQAVAVSTLDEPVCTTIARDLRAIGRKMLVVAIPPLGGDNELRDWDLWGPLLLCCILAMILGGAASSDQSGVVFSAVFVLIWLGSALVTINAKFLGGNVSFFQTVCVMGYCIAPMVAASIIAVIFSNFFVSLILAFGAWIWATYAALRFFRGTVKKEREALVVFPVGLFYFFISWMMAVGL